MPLLDLETQRRAVEHGRIRFGKSTRNANGKKIPTKLETFLFTSRDQAAILALAKQYGGTPGPWDEDPTQWAVLTAAKEIGVVIPPGDAVLSQWWELWNGPTRERQCDGRREYLTAPDLPEPVPCLCARAGRKICKAKSRVKVMLPDAPGAIGVWRVESAGKNAAVELPGTIEMLQKLRSAGQMVPAILRLEIRKTGTNVYAVPVLTLAATMREILSGDYAVRPLAELLPPPPVAALTAGPATPPPPPVPPASRAIPVDQIVSEEELLEQIGHAGEGWRIIALWDLAGRNGWLDVFISDPGRDVYQRFRDHLNDRAVVLGLPKREERA